MITHSSGYEELESRLFETQVHSAKALADRYEQAEKMRASIQVPPEQGRRDMALLYEEAKASGKWAALNAGLNARYASLTKQIDGLLADDKRMETQRTFARAKTNLQQILSGGMESYNDMNQAFQYFGILIGMAGEVGIPAKHMDDELLYLLYALQARDKWHQAWVETP
jgi:hypothetical protein